MSAGFIVGLTGGIGSGKTAVSDSFAKLGIQVVDTDLIAHELTGSAGPAMPALISAFGPAIRRDDGALDRSAMRQLVFSDTLARKRLEAILHPLILEHSITQCQQATSPYVVLAVPLLIESGTYRNRCHRVCVVDCPVEMQIARVMQRSGLQEDEVKSIIASQASREARIAAADDIIDNSASIEHMLTQVKRLDMLYRTLAAP